MAKTSKGRRSTTGNHILLPASPGSTYDVIPLAPTPSFLTWTLGRGSVIWRIWPAVLLHTFFAAVVVTLDMRKIINLEIPNIMLTVLGVVIGFVISYRAISGYDRYWMGRTCWSDIIRNSRTLGRLIWFHVPPRLTAKTTEETLSGQLQRTEEELNKVMAEKRMALDLLQGFAVALKHHIRGELGIYYEDLYHLVRPMHEHNHTADEHEHHPTSNTSHPKPHKSQRITTQTVITQGPPPRQASSSSAPPSPHPSTSSRLTDVDPVIPTINAYGTFDLTKPTSESPVTPSSSAVAIPNKKKPLLRHSASQSSQLSSLSSAGSLSLHRPLMPSAQPPTNDTVLDSVSGDLIPFAATIGMLRQQWAPQPLEVFPPGFRAGDNQNESQQPQQQSQQPPGLLFHPDRNKNRNWQAPVATQRSLSLLHTKHRPKVAGGGENLPLEILRCLSEWCSVLEDRGVVPGTTMGPMIGTIAAFEDSLSALERILTTPLPFVYAVHISTVWMYLFFLPFQLVSQFGYHTIPGVAIAAFIYLGFIAAGEEIEQPFGYDDNDLDLDLFCHSIIRADIKQLKTSPCLNAYFGSNPKHRLNANSNLNLNANSNVNLKVLKPDPQPNPSTQAQAQTLQTHLHARSTLRRARTVSEMADTHAYFLEENEGHATGLNHDWH